VTHVQIITKVKTETKPKWDIFARTKNKNYRD